MGFASQSLDLVSPRILGWPPSRLRDRLVRTSQPSKLRIQGRDGLGGGLDMRNGTLDGLQRSVQLGTSAGSLIAPVGSSAARPNTAQFLGGLVEQDVGVVGQLRLQTPPFITSVAPTIKSKVLG